MAHDIEKKWRSNDVLLFENVDFSSMLLSEPVLSGLSKAGFKKPSPVQLQAIPAGRFGKDLFVQAKSGTGKTLVFVIVALEKLQCTLMPQVLILVPTREIATQICSVFKLVGSSFKKLRCESFIGGLPVVEDRKKALRCQIVVGTPGRVKHLITEKVIFTKGIHLMVFDEADELLQQNWLDDVEEIFNSLPEKKQVIATSATYTPKLKGILFKYLSDPYNVRLDSKKLALLGIVHYTKIVESSTMPLKQYRFRLAALEPILKTVKFTQCLIYCCGIHKVEVLYRDVKKWGFSTAYISSNRTQIERLKAIECLKRFKCKVLVSSDVTARGIDAENVDLVINFDMAKDFDKYLHRSGRAGRYGSVGVTISFVDACDLNYLKNIEKTANFKSYKLPEPVPVDLIQNPCLEEYSMHEKSSEEEYASYEETGEKATATTRQQNGFVCNWKHAIKEDGKKQEKVESNAVPISSSPDIDVNSEKKMSQVEGNEFEKLSRTFCSTIGNEHVSLDAKLQEHNAENCSSANGALMSVNICENTVVNELFVLKCESVLENILSLNNRDLNSNETKILDNSEARNDSTYEKNTKSDILNEYQHSNESGCHTADSKLKSFEALVDCKNLDDIDGTYSNKANSDTLNESDNSDTNYAVPLEKDCIVSTDKKLTDSIATKSSVWSGKNQNEESCFQDTDMGCVKETTFNLNGNELSSVVETFVQNYETSKSIELQSVESVNSMKNSSENFEEKDISSNSIVNLNYKRSDYYYKVFKLFLEENAFSANQKESEDCLEEVKNMPVEKELNRKGEILSSEFNSEGEYPSSQQICESLCEKAHELPNEFECAVESVVDDVPQSAALPCDDIPNFFDLPDQESIPLKNSSYKITKLFDRSALEQAQSKTNSSMAFFEEISEESDSEAESESYQSSKSSLNKSNNHASHFPEDSKSDSVSSSYTDSSSVSSSLTDDKECNENFRSKGSFNENQEVSSLNSSSVHSFVYKKKDRLISTREQDTKLTAQLFSHRKTNQLLHHSSHRSASKSAHQSRRRSGFPQPHHFNHRNSNQLTHSNCGSSYLPPHHFNHLNVYQQTLDSNHLNTCNQLHNSYHPYSQQPPNSVYMPAYLQPSDPINSEYKHHIPKEKCHAIHKNAAHTKKFSCHTSSSGQHTLSCFMPSEHKCHPYNDSAFCSQRAACAQWYQIFYDQWMHIQRCCNATT